MKQIRFGKVILSVVVLVVVMVFCFSFAGKASASDTEETVKEYVVYTVEKGDSLWSIAEANMSPEYDNINDFIDEVVESNHLSRENVLLEGQRLVIPVFVSAE